MKGAETSVISFEAHLIGSALFENAEVPPGWLSIPHAFLYARAISSLRLK